MEDPNEDQENEGEDREEEKQKPPMSDCVSGHHLSDSSGSER